MSSATHPFYKRLREVAKAAGADSPRNRLRRQKEWVAALDALYKVLSSWLQQGVDKGLLRVARDEATLDELSLGTYKAPTLTIHLPGQRVVRLEPIGVEDVPPGYAGRVDMIAGPDKVRLLLEKSGGWKVVQPAGYPYSVFPGPFSSSSPSVDLTDDVFLSLLNDFL